MEYYEILKSIGSGSFGQVYLARNKREEKLYVIKRIKTRDISQKDMENIQNEVRLLQKLRHTNIVAYKDQFTDLDQHLNIVMVYCEGGDMHNNIQNSKGKNFSEDQILDWFVQMALALLYLHNKKILHRDLKTQNIFLKHGRVRLGDFGIAKVLDSTKDFANTCIGTPYYMSPELFKYKPYSYKSDIWAFGCVLYEMCNLRHAFDAQTLNGLAVKIMKGSYPPISTTYSKQFRDLISKMLSLNPKMRPNIFEVINKPLIKPKVVKYMMEIFSGNYPEANHPNDVDDIYIDSLREQAQQLGVFVQIQRAISQGQDSVSDAEIYGDQHQQSQQQQPALKKQKDNTTSSNSSGNTNSGNSMSVKERLAEKEKLAEKKRLLLQQIKERKKIEEEIKRLEQKKQQQQQQQQVTDQKTQQKKTHISQQSCNHVQIERPNARKDQQQASEPGPVNTNIREKRDRSVSLERDSSINKNGNEERKTDKKKITKSKLSQDFRENDKFVQQQQIQQQALSRKITGKESVTSSIDMQKDDFSQQQSTQVSSASGSSFQPTYKERVLLEKEKKRKEQEEQFKIQCQQIYQENAKNRQKAIEKEQAQYRPSTGMRDIIGQRQQQGDKQANNLLLLAGDQQSPQAANSNGLGEQKQRKHMHTDHQDTSEDLTDLEKQQYANIQLGGNNDYQPLINQQYQQQEQGEVKEEYHQKKQYKITEDYTMDDEDKYNQDDEEQQVIKEESDEEDEEDVVDNTKLEVKLETAKIKLKEATLKINELQDQMRQKPGTESGIQIKVGNANQELQKLPEMEEEHAEDKEEDTDDESNQVNEDYNENEGEVQNEPGKVINYNPQYYKVQDRIKVFRHRCQAGLGSEMFQRAYEFLKDKSIQQLKPDDIKKHLVDILGEDLIGYWHLVDQILIFENILQTIPQTMCKQ